MRALLPALFLFVPIAVTAACGSSKSSATTEGPTPRFTLAGDVTPAFLDVPFPSDLYLANGKVIDPLPGLEAVFKTTGAAQMLSHELGKAHGFSRIAMSMFYVDDKTA